MPESLHELQARTNVSKPSRIEKDGCRFQISVESRAIAATFEGMEDILEGPLSQMLDIYTRVGLKLETYHLRLLGHEKSELQIVYAQSVRVQSIGISQETHMLNSIIRLFGVFDYSIH